MDRRAQGLHKGTRLKKKRTSERCGEDERKAEAHKINF